MFVMDRRSNANCDENWYEQDRKLIWSDQWSEPKRPKHCDSFLRCSLLRRHLWITHATSSLLSSSSLTPSLLHSRLKKLTCSVNPGAANKWRALLQLCVNVDVIRVYLMLTMRASSSFFCLL